MQFRTVTPEEKFCLSRMQSLAFNFSIDEKEIREKIEKGEYSGDNTYGAFDDDGRLVSGMEAIPFMMWFDGHTVPMTGIGGVVSAPESRRGGNIRSLFRLVFDDAYEKGVVFSHLYPFSHDFYRKFGYEHVGAAIRYRLPVAPARMLRQSGSIGEYIADKTAPELTKRLKDIYETYASRHNVMISRSEKDWADKLKITLLGTDRLYYWMDDASTPCSWVKFEKKQEELIVKDIAWTDTESMLGIIQFIGLFEGNVKEFTLTASPEFTAELYWPDLYSIKAERTQWLGMNRIINVRRAFELLRKPDDRGRIIVKVHDDFARWNNSTFQIEYDSGGCLVEESDKTPDIELDQRALVQLVLGVYPPETVLQGKGVKVNSDISAACKLFPKKNILIANFF